MKKNINIIALFLICASLFSCGDDDFSVAYSDDEVKTALVGTLVLDRNAAAPSTVLGFSFTLPQSFDVESTVEVTGTSSFSTISINPSVTRSFVTVPAGQTTGTGTITVPGNVADISNDFNGIADYASFEITGIALTQTEENVVADPFVMTSEAVTVRSLDYEATYMDQSLVPNSLVLLFDWEGPWSENDLDMQVYATDFTGPFENAASGSRYEGDFFNDFHPDGDYFVLIQFFSTAAGVVDLNYNFHFTKPDGSIDFYEGTFTAAEIAAGSLFPVINISKATDADGNITYTTSLPM